MAQHLRPPRHAGAQYVAAGVVYLLLSGTLFLLWLTVGNVLLLLLALSTVVAALVELTVGWPRLGRERRARGRQR